jgi:hypothetical protein
MRTVTHYLPGAVGGDGVWDGDILCVTGTRDSYRIDSVTGRITRVSDGKVLRIEFPSNHPMFALYRDTMDRHDIRNPGEPNPFRALLCAFLLNHDDEYAGLIVVDEF